ncbi:MAG: PDZ domain-containing protein [Phycisphaera sp.]|nr:MAG: PDZ domain-containing protein [Phycisphaera sp.]
MPTNVLAPGDKRRMEAFMGCVQVLSRAFAASVAMTVAVSGSTAQVAELQSSDWSKTVWDAASVGDRHGTLRALQNIPDDIDPDNTTDIRAAIDLLNENFEKQAEEREKQIAEKREELNKLLDEAASNDPEKLSEALATVLFLDSIVLDRKALLNEPQIRDLIRRSAQTAATAESKQNWLRAMELYARLNYVEEASQEYKDDLERQLVRREMLTLYVPERYWELRDARLRELEAIAQQDWDEKHAELEANPDATEEDYGELGDRPEIEGLPEYNPRGGDYEEKLDGVTPELVWSALAQGARHHISGTQLKTMLVAGIENLEMLIEMEDLELAFPELKQDASREKLLAHLETEIRNLEAARKDISPIDLRRTLNRLIEVNAATVNLPPEVVIHEVGSGGMAQLDEFSQIVWPHELRTFYKRLDSSFIGVGIQIINDPVTGDLQVYTPMPGMPAVRAGVRAGDYIVKVDGESTVGMTTDQAVEVITGPRGTDVTLTVRRENDEGEELIKDITITRDEIEVATVTGWRKLSPAKGDWDWYVDKDQKIGYVRLDKFAQDSTNELDAAINDMRKTGLNGLILDLRFNSGGQLNQAIEISNRFIENGTLVSTVNSRTEPPSIHSANKWKATLAGLPVVMLVNSNSASSSEIVAGAIKDYGDAGNIHALVLGERTYGKGTVQNLHRVGANAAMKVTTQYYQLPSGKIIHRRPGDTNWGVAPDLDIPLLPSQVNEWLTLRRDADVFQIDENGQVLEFNPRDPDAEITERPDPRDLIEKGIDLQLQTAVVLLKSQAPMKTSSSAMLGG